jgi:hypothetical protein
MQVWYQNTGATAISKDAENSYTENRTGFKKIKRTITYCHSRPEGPKGQVVPLGRAFGGESINMDAR